MDPITMSLVAGAIGSLSDSGNEQTSDVSTSDLLKLKQAEQEQKAKQQQTLIIITISIIVITFIIVGILVYKRTKS